MAQVRLDGVDAVAGFGDDAQVGFLVDDVRDAGPEQRVIVDQQHACAGGTAIGVSGFSRTLRSA